VEHGVLVGDDLEVLRAHLGEERCRIRPQRGLELEMAHAAIPAEGIAVGRQIDERVAGDSLLAERMAEPAELCGVFEVACRLEKSERPARRHRRAPE
jgi:hypothetical protein